MCDTVIYIQYYWYFSLVQNASRQQSLPTNFTDLVQSMLKFNADDRPTIEELYKQILCL